MRRTLFVSIGQQDPVRLRPFDMRTRSSTLEGCSKPVAWHMCSRSTDFQAQLRHRSASDIQCDDQCFSRYGSSGSWGAVMVRFGRDLFVSTFMFIYIYVSVRFRLCPWWFQPLCSLVCPTRLFPLLIRPAFPTTNINININIFATCVKHENWIQAPPLFGQLWSTAAGGHRAQAQRAEVRGRGGSKG